MRRVYVDGIEVDTGGKGAPSLILNSPLFTDLDAIKLNRTTSYELPLTGRNRAALGLAGDAMAETTYPRRVHAFEEYRDGVPVISGGRARIVSATRESVTLSVTWGSLLELKEVLGKKLNEMEGGVAIWNESTPWMGSTGERVNGWMQYDVFGDGSAPEIRYTLPCVRVDNVLNRATFQTGVIFSRSIEVSEEIKKLWIPCLTKNAGNASAKKTVVRMRGWAVRHLWFVPGLPAPVDYWHAFSAWDTQEDANGITFTTGSAISVEDAFDPAPPFDVVKLKRGGAYKARVVLEDPAETYPVGTRIVARVGSVTAYGPPILPDAPLTAVIEMDVEGKGGEDGEDGYLWVEGKVVRTSDGKLLRRIRPFESQGLQKIELTLTPADDEVNYPTYDYPLYANLPDMTILSFLKALCQVLGLYVTGEGDGRIRLHRSNDLVNRSPGGASPRVVDLDRLVITRDPDALSYKFGDYARANEFKYAEDDTVTAAAANATVYIDDDTLAATRVAVELPFAACDSVPRALSSGETVREAVIPVFVRDPDTQEVKFNGDKLKPRIVRTVKDAGVAYVAVFDETLGWPSLLSNSEWLKRLLISPRVVKVTALVSPVDLQEWSTSVPVFYWKGRHWLYTTITAAADGTAEIEMVEIGTAGNDAIPGGNVVGEPWYPPGNGGAEYPPGYGGTGS